MPTYKQATITIKEGNIVSEPADALVTLINSGGMWFGGVDDAIQSVAGNEYHSTAMKQKMVTGLRDGQVITAKGPANKSWSFQDVIFVVDDLKVQLNDLVFVAVEEAYQQGYTSITLPAMRTGVMKNQVEPIHMVPLMMLNGIARAVDLYERKMNITIVVYHDQAMVGLMNMRAEQLAQHRSITY